MLNKKDTNKASCSTSRTRTKHRAHRRTHGPGSTRCTWQFPLYDIFVFLSVPYLNSSFGSPSQHLNISVVCTILNKCARKAKWQKLDREPDSSFTSWKHCKWLFPITFSVSFNSLPSTTNAPTLNKSSNWLTLVQKVNIVIQNACFYNKTKALPRLCR